MLIALLTPAFAYENAPAQSTIQRVEQMVWDNSVTAAARRFGLSVLNVTWEDTGRYKNSVWGANISDMTIGVRDSQGLLHPMPVVRFDNYNDKTADLSPEDFWVRVGNERGGRLHTVSLADLLQDTRSYLSDPYSWRGRTGSLWASRDSNVLVSAQACFLPVPKSGSATFTPVLYNYQSSAGNPAVLTMVATREGTSIQVVENEGGYMSEVLSFNDDGERAPFTAERLSDFAAHGGDATSGPVNWQNVDGLNVVLVVQVPLKHQEPRRELYGYAEDDYSMSAPAAEGAAKASRRSDVESAVIGHGPVEGPFKEIDGLAIERDPRYPVRVTVQFYKATSSGVVTEEDIRQVRAQIDRVYANADYVGSLVTEGYTGRQTEWVRPQPYPQPQPTENAQWADGFWGWKAY